MDNFFVLRILDNFEWFFNKLGVDYQNMRRILQLKLVMDSRRVPTILGSSKKADEEGNSFIKSLWIYSLMSLVVVPFVYMKLNYMLQMSIVFGILMFMIMTSLISDFSGVLLDIRDKNIILSKPVENKTLSMAKTIHVLIYLFLITISLAIIPLVTALLRQGILFFILFLLEIIFMDLFIVALTALLYLLILKFFDGEKLKDIINYVQIGLSIAIAVGYQFIGRLFNFIHFKVIFCPKWWQYFIIPTWFAAPFELVLHHSRNIYFVIFTILGIIVPVISIISYIKLMPSFERNLQKLNNSNGKTKKGKNRIFKFVSNIICPNKEDRVFFRFALDMFNNERQFKLRVYPSLALSAIFPFIFILNDLRGSSIHAVVSSKSYFNIYFCALFIPTVIMMIKYSESYKGAWIYGTVPIKDFTSTIKSFIKAFVIRLLIPIYLFDSIIFTFVFGFRIVPDLVIVFLNFILITIICSKILITGLPFSQPYGTEEKSQGVVAIPIMIIVGVLCLIHFICAPLNCGLLLYGITIFIINIIAWKMLKFNFEL